MRGLGLSRRLLLTRLGGGPGLTFRLSARRGLGLSLLLTSGLELGPLSRLSLLLLSSRLGLSVLSRLSLGGSLGALLLHLHQGLALLCQSLGLRPLSRLGLRVRLSAPGR